MSLGLNLNLQMMRPKWQQLGSLQNGQQVGQNPLAEQQQLAQNQQVDEVQATQNDGNISNREKGIKFDAADGRVSTSQGDKLGNVINALSSDKNGKISTDEQDREKVIAQLLATNPQLQQQFRGLDPQNLKPEDMDKIQNLDLKQSGIHELKVPQQNPMAANDPNNVNAAQAPLQPAQTNQLKPEQQVQNAKNPQAAQNDQVQTGQGKDGVQKAQNPEQAQGAQQPPQGGGNGESPASVAEAKLSEAENAAQSNPEQAKALLSEAKNLLTNVKNPEKLVELSTRVKELEQTLKPEAQNEQTDNAQAVDSTDQANNDIQTSQEPQDIQSAKQPTDIKPTERVQQPSQVQEARGLQNSDQIATSGIQQQQPANALTNTSIAAFAGQGDPYAIQAMNTQIRPRLPQMIRPVAAA